MIYLHKILPLLVSPLFLIIILVLWGSLYRSRRAGIAAIGILIVCSLPVFSNKLISYLEKDYSLIPPANAKTADAIVVLSGMVRTIDGANGLKYEWGEASDRIFAGIDLIKENKAPALVLTGGKLPWSVGKPEGEHLRDIAEKLGVPSDVILLTENVQNTDQEAKAVIKLLNKEVPKIILVTSAFHMPRAQKVFEVAGIAVSPFPVDFLSKADNTKIMDFMPDAKAFQDTSFFVREVIGRLYYNLKY
jgi:uncharacterized SAM-binding protein YcdF (DUF218 family)